MKRRAFTLIEVMVCIAIIGVLAGLCFPAFSRAKRAAKETVSLSNVRQIWTAVKLYQQDYGGEGVYGKPSEMGLPVADASNPYEKPPPPSVYQILERDYHLPMAIWMSGCGCHLTDIYHVNNIVPAWTDEVTYAPEVALFRENTILVYDVNCSDPGASLRNYQMSHLGIGALLSGSAVRRHKPGNYTRAAWWSDPEP